MRIARRLVLALSLSVAPMPWALADTVSMSDPNTNPHALEDPDGVPLSVTEQKQGPTPTEINAQKAMEEKAAMDKDWLLRSYEEQLQSRKSTTSDASDDLYYKISSNKDLARLAGLPLIDPVTSQDPKAARSVESDAIKVAQAVGANAPQTSDPVSQISHGYTFKPLITPLSATEAAGLHNFYASLPNASTSGLVSSPPAPAKIEPKPEIDQGTDTLALETPGLIAAEKEDPQMTVSGADLTLDMLPGESVAEAKSRQENYSKLDLPLPPTADSLSKPQTITMIAPNATKTPVAPKPVVRDTSEDPMPVGTVPSPSPIRSPIANPFDILNR